MKQMEKLVLRMPLNARGFEHISQLRNLISLSVRGDDFRDADMAPLASLSNLEELSLGEGRSIDGTFAAYLADLQRLQKLTPGSASTDEGLANIARLTNLTVLYLEGPFTDRGMRHIGSLTKLRTLSIISGHVTHEGVAVVARLPRLSCLFLTTPGLTDDGIPAILHCAALEALHLSTTCVTDGGLQYLRDALPMCGVEDSERDRCPYDESEEDQGVARVKFDSSTPLATLLAKACDFDLINAVFSKISDRHSPWVDVSAYTPEERVVMLVWHSSGIISNGGIEYLFAGEFDNDPDFRITAEAYKTAGLDRSYEAFQAAFNLFPGGVVPHDPEERARLFFEANKSARQALDRTIWHDARAQQKKLAEFIRQHADDFVDLDND